MTSYELPATNDVTVVVCRFAVSVAWPLEPAARWHEMLPPVGGTCQAFRPSASLAKYSRTYLRSHLADMFREGGGFRIYHNIASLVFVQKS